MTKQSLTFYIDGQYFKVPPQVVEAFTPGVCPGKGVIETMLAVGGKVFDLQAHLKRLRTTMPKIEIPVVAFDRVIAENGFPVSRVRVLAWRGEGRQTHSAVMALPYTPPAKTVFKVCLIKTKRPASARFANIKSLDYQLFAEAYHQAQAKGCDEALLLNAKGHIFEASRANLFIMSDGKLLTPSLSSGCLNGITRQKTIKAARQLGTSVLETNITPAMLKSAQEAFLTNSLLGIKPVKTDRIVDLDY